MSQPKGDFEVNFSSSMKTTTKLLLIYSGIAILLICMVLYCLYNIFHIVMFYYSQRNANTDLGNKKKSDNPIMPTDDNEYYINKEDSLIAENTDEYARYTKEINKHIAEFKTYNAQVKAYYKANKPGETPPDLIDKSILLKDSDNY